MGASAGAEPRPARREASWANRWCFRVIELAGELRRGRGCPVFDDKGGGG